MSSVIEEKIRDEIQLHVQELTALKANGEAAQRHRRIADQNIKQFGYQFAKLERKLHPIDIKAQYKDVGLTSKLCTQGDMDSEWFYYWCNELKIQPIYHRKIWEYAFVCQALREFTNWSGSLQGIGFGCGEEPIPSLLAKNKHFVTVTDLSPEAAAAKGWIDTAQHTSFLDQVFVKEIVEKSEFDNQVRLEYLDMNEIPDSVKDYDYCWSICALEHLGNIDKGLEFIKNSLGALKSGGVAVHTTEYNVYSDDQTIESGDTVIFRKKDFLRLFSELESLGHKVMAVNWDAGTQPLDRYIDIPPYGLTEKWLDSAQWIEDNGAGHLKLEHGDLVTTCIGLIVIKQ